VIVLADLTYIRLEVLEQQQLAGLYVRLPGQLDIPDFAVCSFAVCMTGSLTWELHRSLNNNRLRGNLPPLWTNLDKLIYLYVLFVVWYGYLD
jgi:hypothetical protein